MKAQSVLESFWEEKNKLDETAKRNGLRSAIPLDVYPHLIAALRNFEREGGYHHRRGPLGGDDQRKYLLNAARNMSVLAVRDKDANALRWAILALVVEDCQLDYRESLINLALLNHSANKTGVDLEKIFDSVKHCCSPQMLKFIVSFLMRPSEKQSIDAFGYVEITRKGGFDYKCQW
jgi:hypothetical protein